MALEDLTGTKYINSLVSANPVGATDPKSEGDDHIRGIKNVLKLSLPNITGAITATQAELNVLDGQVGGFLLTANATGGGTADAITATFSPAITLTNGTTVIVRAVGANTITNPTFNANALGVKTIVKNSNAALAVGDIAGASHELVLKYNSTNDNWSLINPFSNFPHPAAVSGYDRGTTISAKDDVTYGYEEISSTVTESTWVRIGPTGSGATVVTTFLDPVPSGATHVILGCWVSAVHDITAVTEISIQLRETGSSETLSHDTLAVVWNGQTYAAQTRYQCSEVMVPLDSNNTFEVNWYSSFATSSSARLTLKGWIK